MKLYIMRHGPAEDFSTSGRDGDRALTESGRERVRAVAKLLAAQGEAPRAIVSSPLVRALQTAEIVAHEIGVDLVETAAELAPGGDGSALVRTLLKEERKRVMVVGHEPDLSTLVTALIGAPFGYEMLKAMVVGVQVPPRALREAPEAPALRFVLDPKKLEVVTPK